MTHPLTTLEGQQAALIERLPNIAWQMKNILAAEYSDELPRTVSNRLASGHRVFGHKMFTWEAGDLWTEAIEELADAVLYFMAYLYVSEHGPVREEVNA